MIIPKVSKKYENDDYINRQIYINQLLKINKGLTAPNGFKKVYYYGREPFEGDSFYYKVKIEEFQALREKCLLSCYTTE